MLLGLQKTFAQKPSKAQMEADKKEYAAAQTKLEAEKAKMDPKTRQAFDSLLNSMGVKDMPSLQEDAKPPTAQRKVGATPTASTLAPFLAHANAHVFTSLKTGAKQKSKEVLQALQKKGASPTEIGQVAMVLWTEGRTEVALGLLSLTCLTDLKSTDNLANYAAMLSMCGAPDLAIPLLNHLHAQFRKNSTVLNNLGQAWYRQGDLAKATVYLDSTLLLNAGHPQANETLCRIAQTKGKSAAAAAYAQRAFQNGQSSTRRDLLKNLGHALQPEDYGSFPPSLKGKDLLQLGNFAMPPFPKSTADFLALEPVWKQFRAEISEQLRPLQKTSEASATAMREQLEKQQKDFFAALNKSLSTGQNASPSFMNLPMYGEEMNLRQKRVLENLQEKKQSIVEQMKAFYAGPGAEHRKKYQDELGKIQERWKNVGQGGTEDEGTLCRAAVKASDHYLAAMNAPLEGLYLDYLSVERQWLNEMAYASLYTTYPEILPGLLAGLKMQWLRDLSLTQNGFNFEVVNKYACVNESETKKGKLTAFVDPNCTINSEFTQALGVANLGFSIKITCAGLQTSINALALGFTLNQDLDHAGFGDSFRNCTVSIGPKIGASMEMGPVEVGAKAGMGADIEIDRSGVTDVLLTGGAEVEASIGNPVSASAGMEGRMSLNSGSGSVQGTGIFK